MSKSIAEKFVYTAVAKWPNSERREIVVTVIEAYNPNALSDTIAQFLEKVAEKGLEVDTSILPVVTHV